MAVSTKPTDWIHLEAGEGSAVSEIIRAAVNEINALQSGVNDVKRYFQVENSYGLSLDALGALLNTYRKSDESDGDYRTRLLNTANETESQTEDAIQAEVYRIAGCTPQVDTYPDVDFVAEYGMSKNNGIVRVLVPFNKWELWGDDIQSRLPMVVAAGIAIIAEAYDRYFEEFYDTVLISDYTIIHLTAYPPLTEEEIPDRIARIGIAQIGIHVLGHGVDIIYSNWDEGQWDEAKWDGGHVQVNTRDGI